MCGIFSYISYIDNPSTLSAQDCETIGDMIKHRGPDQTNQYRNENDRHLVHLVFHRLRINDLSQKGMQPFVVDDVVLLCNGEIFNHREIESVYQLECESSSDCECLIRLYIYCVKNDISFESCISMLDGDFAFVLYDSNIDEILYARDPFGVRSMYVGRDLHSWFMVAIASEMKALTAICDGEITPVTPGTITRLKLSNRVEYKTRFWEPVDTNLRLPMFTKERDDIHTLEKLYNQIATSLQQAVDKRMLTDKDIGCLLSGGLDSSVVAALVTRSRKEAAKLTGTDPKPLHTFSVGLSGGTDLKYAASVAEHIGSIHHEIIVTEDELIASIPDLIRQIETYDLTTVRASCPMYHLAKKITKINPNISVIFSGEGADEVCAGYMYFHSSPTSEDLDSECRRLIRSLHRFDVLRAEKTIAGAGLEARFPFLDKNFIDTYLTQASNLRHPSYFGIEKGLLRRSIEQKFPRLIPQSVLYRKKEAFSDGISSMKRPWFQILQENAKSRFVNLSGVDAEKMLYKTIFIDKFGDRTNVIPYYWLPRWQGDIEDPSARILEVYSKTKN